MSIIIQSKLLLLFDSFITIETVFCPPNTEKSRPAWENEWTKGLTGIVVDVSN